MHSLGSGAAMSEPGYHGALRILCDDASGGLHRALAAACESVPAWDPVVYLADFAHQVLFPLAGDAAEQQVAGSMAGRAFTTGQPVTSLGDGPVRVWVPVVERTTRTGVLAVTVRHADPQVLAKLELLGVFAGLVVGSAARVSDVPYVRRRGWSRRTTSPVTRSTMRSTAPICISRSSMAWDMASARRC